VRLHRFSGSHYEIGVQQGQAVREQLDKATDDIPRFEAVRLLKPSLLPTSLFMSIARRRAARMLKKDVFQFYPRQSERLTGIVEGARTNLSNILFMHALELSLGGGAGGYRLDACTTFAFDSAHTASGDVIVAKNFDYMNDLQPYQLTCETKPKDGYATLGCKMSPLAGILDGMNQYGLTVTYNLAYTLEKPKCYVPLSMVLQEMLETCRNVSEAAEFILQSKRGGHDAVLTLADAEDSIRTVEITPNHAIAYEAIDGKVVNTNHYKSVEMQRYEIPHNAVFAGKRVPKEHLGVRVHGSSEKRLERVEELLKGTDRIGEDIIIAALADHDKDNAPSMFTICRHAAFASTLRSVIFYPHRRAIKVLYGKPCENRYAEFKFS
jgi:predicted choloylglycine hydrolase